MMRRNLLVGLLACVGCGSSSGAIDGSVMGSSLDGAVPAFSVHRLANTQLSPNLETLELYFGNAINSGFCPDILLPSDATTLVFGLRAPAISVGSYPVCDGFDCEGKHVEFGLFDGWQLPSGETVEPTTGSVEVTEFTDERVTGTFSFDFSGESVTGEFDLEIACVDMRPGQ